MRLRFVESALVLGIALAVSSCGREPTVSGGARAETPAAVSVAKFADATEEAGLAFRQSNAGCGMRYFVEQVASGAALFDADGDGDLDIYFPQPKPIGVCSSEVPLKQRLFLNDGKGKYTLAPQAFSGKDTDYGIGAAVGDYDNDGDADLYVSCFGKNTLYRNRGNATFEDVTETAGVEFGGVGTGAVFFDYDKDGFLDLYAMRYCDWSIKNDIACPGPNGERDLCDPRIYDPSTNRLYRNNGNGSFTDVTQKATMGTEKRRSLGAATVDFDDDGWLDLFVANDLGPNYLYMNNQDGTFRETAMQAGVAFGITGTNQANMGVAVGDFNDSGRQSVLVSTFSNEPYTLYRNDGGFFTDVSAPTGIAEATLPYLSFGTGFFDARNLGRLDLFFANGHVSLYAGAKSPDKPKYKQRNQLLLSSGDGTFKEDLDALPKENVRVHRGACFGDVNADGRVDVLVTANNDRPTLLRNESTPANWLIVKLTDRNGCVTPVGARLTATLGPKKLLRDVIGGGSYGGDSDHRVHFGLGSVSKVDRLEVKWLSGRTQIVENVEVNKVLALQEPKG